VERVVFRAGSLGALAVIAIACAPMARAPRSAESPRTVAATSTRAGVATSATATTGVSVAVGADTQTSSTACAVVPAGERDILEAEDETDEGAPEEEESREASTLVQPGLRYTADISDEELEAKWRSRPESLGSISIGFADEGRMINAVQFPCGDGTAWTVVSPENTWGTTETIGFVLKAVERVRSLHPNAPPLRINQISAREGGYLRPHRSHQNGRDVDLAFYYPTATPIRSAAREKVIDVALSFELLKSLVLLTDVQVVLVDRRVQKVLYEYALGHGEDPAWLDSLFHAGLRSLVQHARRHRDHFHVRFFNGRAQELGRRVAPLLAQRPDQNLAMVRVKKGDTLGAIAIRYKSSVTAIQKANYMKSSFLHIAQILKVPMRGPCTQCPIPPPFEIPERRLPPGMRIDALTAARTSSRALDAVTSPSARPIAQPRAESSAGGPDPTRSTSP
jgi:murein endopeptidase